MNKNKLSRSTVIEFIKSNIAGNALFVTTYISYFLFNSVFDMSVGISLLYATIIGNTLGNLINFLAQKYWVFQRHNAVNLQAGRYVVFMIMNAAINYAIILALDQFLGITPYVGQFIAGLFFWVWNYVWYKRWVFEKGDSDAARTPQ